MKRRIYPLLCFILFTCLTLSACSSSKKPVVKKTSSGKTTTTIVVEEKGKEQEYTYEKPYISNNRTMSYDESKDVTTITEGEVTVSLLGKWEDWGDCFTSGRYGTVNLINRGEQIAVSDFSGDVSTQSSWSINKEAHDVVITTVKTGVNCYNFHIHSQTSTYQFFYTTHPDTSIDDATLLINTVLKTFSFGQPEEGNQSQQPVVEKKQQNTSPDNKKEEENSDTEPENSENEDQETSPSEN